MLLYEFYNETIALKSVNLLKVPLYILKEMQKEVEIYKDLADIQVKAEVQLSIDNSVLVVDVSDSIVD
ncbi:5796_t:CDS:2 [Funneliformis mosseae]|uniref:5796_t:CDS:1 n=1 Tax=Funneliformis mosseae TaxID=27381 RepID=A0A9N9B7A9_FUNMO|nr:5796_t:CDS:2 [Funneliformis mosseae]